MPIGGDDRAESAGRDADDAKRTQSHKFPLFDLVGHSLAVRHLAGDCRNIDSATFVARSSTGVPAIERCQAPAVTKCGRTSCPVNSGSLSIPVKIGTSCSGRFGLALILRHARSLNWGCPRQRKNSSFESSSLSLAYVFCGNACAHLSIQHLRGC